MRTSHFSSLVWSSMHESFQKFSVIPLRGASISDVTIQGMVKDIKQCFQDINYFFLKPNSS